MKKIVSILIAILLYFIINFATRISLFKEPIKSDSFECKYLSTFMEGPEDFTLYNKNTLLVA
jgi:hypothetical protein